MAETYKILRGGLLLDPATGTHAPRDILLKGTRIAEIGAPGMEAPEAAEVVDASDHLLMPGMINAHSHGHGSLGKGMGDRWTLEHLLHAGPWLNTGRDFADMTLSAQLNAAEMLMKGCTAAYDLYFEFPASTTEGLNAVAEGYESVGLRSVIAPMMADLSLYQAIPGLLAAMPEEHRPRFEAIRLAPAEQLLAMSRAALTNWRFDREKTRIALAPTIPLHCTDDFLTGCRDLSEEFGVGLHMHLSESRTQVVTGLERYGMTLTAHLDKLGLLSDRFTAAHGVWLDDEDIARLADHGASVAHNAGSNLRLGNGIAPARKILKAGLNLGIGTDGSSSADDQNMFISMRMASYASRIMSPDTNDWLSTPEVLHAATAGSAKALGFGDEIGTIAEGKQADIVFLDLNAVGLVPLNNAANQLVHAEDSTAVHHVMIGGEMVLKDRKLTRVNFADLRRKAEAANERLIARNADLRDFSIGLEKYVSQFCVGIACCPYHEHRFAGHAHDGSCRH
ncbi:amidohydrolase family protein [Maritimibacter alkaliphilus]|uniref:amidohydrolase family protein n=1 Tax=Maritimibacter alkaliphilus TaxID=404236 RepID=UPI001C97E021|nr:amidohydrolase family protein [Maritimibacter alkaliphilus]MBY6089678.1 amidohydrolase family protein [Maritimibacter alkaliphilus]